MRARLLLRGEQPEIPTGYNLVSLMYGNVKYVSRPIYARREEMLNEHANALARSGSCILRVDDILASVSGGLGLNFDGSMPLVPQVKGSKKVVIVSEGAGDAFALLGEIILLRNIELLSFFLCTCTMAYHRNSSYAKCNFKNQGLELNMAFYVSHFWLNREL